jgi:hypothetical protein
MCAEADAGEGVTLKSAIDQARIVFAYSADGATFTTLLADADARVLTLLRRAGSPAPWWGHMRARRARRRCN